MLQPAYKRIVSFTYDVLLVISLFIICNIKIDLKVISIGDVISEANIISENNSLNVRNLWN